jgi:hypothetical protein
MHPADGWIRILDFEAWFFQTSPPNGYLSHAEHNNASSIGSVLQCRMPRR